jgi:hypothetical protein
MVYDFEKRINEQLRPCFQTEVARKENTRKDPKFPTFRGVKRNRERALGLKSTPLDKRIRGS